MPPFFRFLLYSGSTFRQLNSVMGNSAYNAPAAPPNAPPNPVRASVAPVGASAAGGASGLRAAQVCVFGSLCMNYQGDMSPTDLLRFFFFLPSFCCQANVPMPAQVAVGLQVRRRDYFNLSRRFHCLIS
jgi:hypothetical protein